VALHIYVDYTQLTCTTHAVHAPGNLVLECAYAITSCGAGVPFCAPFRIPSPSNPANVSLMDCDEQQDGLS